MDLHLECPVTLRIRDQRRNPLRRQRRVDEDERHAQEDSSRRSSHSCSPRLQACQPREVVQPVAGIYNIPSKLYTYLLISVSQIDCIIGHCCSLL